LFGGLASDALKAALAGRSAKPSEDHLVSLARSGEGHVGKTVLDLEAPTWSQRDAFVFAVLSMQQSLGIKVAAWSPVPERAPEEAALAQQPKIVAPPAPTPAVRATQLGGSHGSLKPRVSSTPKSPFSSASSSSAAAGAASPSKAGAASASGAAANVELSDVLVKLCKLFEDGRNFIRFTSGSAKPFYIALWMVRDKPAADGGQGDGKAFTLHWARADSRTIDPAGTRSIRSADIEGVSIGKQASVFRKSEASLAPSSHCFSIIARTASLHLQAWNDRDADTYAFGLASLLKAAGHKPRLWQAGQYLESSGRVAVENAAEQREQPDGTQAVDPRDIPALANAQGYKCEVSLSVKAKSLPAAHGNHIVCMFERNDDTEQLAYLAQTEKQKLGATGAGAEVQWRKTFKLQYDSRPAFEGRKLRFNVYDLPAQSKQMDDEDRIGSALLHLKDLVDNAGIDYVFKLTHEVPAKQQALLKSGATLTLQCISKSEAQLV